LCCIVVLESIQNEVSDDPVAICRISNPASDSGDLKYFNSFGQLRGRGSWIRTNDLQYPKLPRYQAALYPDYLGSDVDTRLKQDQQGCCDRLNDHSF
ncbi:MAG: hypothetical protein QOE39_1759, partial [Bradyrhizobium sp.]|nr:hypothetical protein [Bradyrhizobium sp.]